MRLTRLRVDNFGCIGHVELDLDADWVVVHGPNDIGKSTLARAIRMAFLARINSTVWDDFQPWGSSEKPEVSIDFQLADDPTTYRVIKSPTTALLQLRASDNAPFHDDQRNAQVNEKLFTEILRWGLGDPKGHRGMASSFIAELLFTEQDKVSSILTDADGVGEDKHESAREWLIEVLEAKSTDPKFREMLQNVVERCGEFFTATGRHRKSADSPIRMLQDEIEEVRKRKKELEDKWSEMSGVREELKAERQQLEDATEALTTAEEKLQKAQKQARLRDAYEKARDKWKTANDRAEKIAATEETLEERNTEAEELATRIDRLKAELEEKKAAWEKAREELRSLEQRTTDVDKERRRGELQKKLSETETAQSEFERKLERARGTVERWDKYQKAVEKESTLQARVKTLSEELTRKRNGLGELEKQLRAARMWNLQNRLTEVRGKAAEFVKTKERATRELKQTNEALAELKRREDDLPSDEVLRELETLESELKLAEGRLAVGLEISMELEQPRRVTATLDDEEKQPRIETSLRWNADRTASLVIEGVGELTVRGGDIGEHAEVDRLRDEWKQLAEPAFQRAGVASLSELHALVESHQERRETLEHQAEEARSQLPDPDHVAETKARIDELEDELREVTGEDLPPEEGEPPAEDVRDAEALADDVESRQNDIRDLEQDLVVAESKLESAVEARKELAPESEQDAEAEAETARAFCEKADAKRAELESKQEALKGELEALDGAQKAALGEARETAEKAKEAVEELGERLEKLDESHDEVVGQINQLSGELKSQRESFDAEELDQLKATLDATPKPDERVIEQDLEELELQVDRCDRRVDELNTSIAKHEGHLQSALGPAAEEELEALTTRFEALEKRQTELLTNAHGWELLQKVMKDVEASEAGNLGASVVPLVEPRIREIAGASYGLEVDPKLAGGGTVKTPGGPTELERVSVGTREQIATLFRLALAERLRSTIVLDDQLVQSDPVRMSRLRRLLLEVSRQAQILVFTCRPDEYRVDDAAFADLKQELSR